MFLNSFATRSFRDTADQDYITARLACRSALHEQFHWSALQAIEKYFKAIFLYNRIKAKNLGHSLSKALKKSEELPFTLSISDESIQMLSHLDAFGKFRYFEASFYTYGPKLYELDKLIWELRRYCQVIDWTYTNSEGKVVNTLTSTLEAIEKSDVEAPQRFRLPNGKLEKILDTSDHAARAPLIWQNVFYGSRARKMARIPSPTYAANSPLTLNPELLEEVLEYVYLPKEVVDAYRQESKSREH